MGGEHTHTEHMKRQFQPCSVKWGCHFSSKAKSNFPYCSSNTKLKNGSELEFHGALILLDVCNVCNLYIYICRKLMEFVCVFLTLI